MSLATEEQVQFVRGVVEDAGTIDRIRGLHSSVFRGMASVGAGVDPDGLAVHLHALRNNSVNPKAPHCAYSFGVEPSELDDRVAAKTMIEERLTTALEDMRLHIESEMAGVM